MLYADNDNDDRKFKNTQIKMLTYKCVHVTQDDAAVDGVGCGVFGPPASEKNDAQPPNTNNERANVRDTALLGRVVNAATTRIGGPPSGGLALVNPGLKMATAGSQATGQVSLG